MELLNAVTAALNVVLKWLGTICTSLFSPGWSLNGLLPLMAVGVGVSALLLGIKAIRSFIWGA